MKKLMDFLTDPYVVVPTLLGGVVGYFVKGKEADGAGRYMWPAGGVAAGLAAGYAIRSRRSLTAEEAAAAALAQAAKTANAAQAGQKAAQPGVSGVAQPVRQIEAPPTVSLDEYEPEMDYDGDSDISVDDMFIEEGGGMPLEAYEPATEPVAAPSAGFRGPAPAPVASANPSEEYAYKLADEISANETGHGSLGGGNGSSDADLAGGWGGFSEGTLNGDVEIDDLADGVPGMTDIINKRNGNGVH